MEGARQAKVIVSGILFWYPLAGVTYQFLHYLIGLQRLGYDVYYVEDSSRWIYDPSIGEPSPDPSWNIGIVAPILDKYGFGDRWAFRGRYDGGCCHGMSESQLAALYRDADAFLNVTGAQELYDEHLAIPRRVYIESDPFHMQVKAGAGDPACLAMLGAHDTLFTYGQLVGTPACLLPTGGLEWLPTRQPVVVDLWRQSPVESARPFTTITTWRNDKNDMQWQGETYYWTKDRAFQPFLTVAGERPGLFELAVDAPPQDTLCLEELGWRCVDAIAVSRDAESYRSYIRSSRGEFTASRDQVVRPHTGWFSDRSASYLAAARPVVTQDTGFGEVLPTGKGLFAFSSVDDVLAAVDAIASDYSGNAAAALAIADEYFEAEKVLASALARAGW